MAVVNLLKASTSQDPYSCMHTCMLRCLVFCEVHYTFQITAAHIPSILIAAAKCIILQQHIITEVFTLVGKI